MRKKILTGALCSVFLITVGCGIEPGVSGKSRTEYLNSIKSYIEYWLKPGMTVDSRRQDSWSCGTAPTVYAAENVVFSPETINAEKRPEEERNKPAIDRLTVKWVECMKARGYVWVKEQ